MTVFAVTVSEKASISLRTPLRSRYAGSMVERGRAGVYPTDNAGYRFVKGVAFSIAERGRLRSSAAIVYRAGVKLAERAGGRIGMRPTVTYHVALKSGTLRVKGVFSVGIVQRLLERGLVREGVLRASPMLRMRERLRIVQRQNVVHQFSVLMRAAARIGLVQRLGIGASIHAAMKASDRLARLYHAVAVVSEQAVVHTTGGVQLLVVVNEREDATIDDATMVRAVLSGRLADTGAFSIAVLDPGASTTTWAINTRTGAVSEYTNFDFNAYTRMPSGRFLASAADGLYELNADSDDGDPIVADIISGLIEMTGSTFTSLRAAYLGVRGAGEFLLRLTAGNGRSTTYRVLTKPMTTARINTGKGWRTRYFQFQLVSTGQDFDLQGIEFLPIASVRRV